MIALIIGTGSIGQRHIRNIKQIDNNIQFIFLRHKLYEDKLSHELGARVITNIDQINSSEVDFSIIANPSSMHTDMILYCIDKQIPFYIEKPIVTSREDLKKLHLVVSQSHLPINLVGCNLRFLPSLQHFKFLITNGAIGSPIRASFHAGQWLPDWRPTQNYKEVYSSKSHMGGGVIMDLIHEIDMTRYLIGEFDQVMSIAKGVQILDIEVESNVCALLANSTTDCITTLCLDYVSRKPIRHYQVVGTHGTLTWNLANKSFILSNSYGDEIINLPEEAYSIELTYENAIDTFIHNVNNNTPFENDIHEGIKSVDLALQIKEAAF